MLLLPSKTWTKDSSESIFVCNQHGIYSREDHDVLALSRHYLLHLSPANSTPNSVNSSVAILDFWHCRLLNLTTYLGKDLKKQQMFFKYFSIHTLTFEKMYVLVDYVICSGSGVE
jgi:hypothetical protein